MGIFLLPHRGGYFQGHCHGKISLYLFLAEHFCCTHWIHNMEKLNWNTFHSENSLIREKILYFWRNLYI
jgi:hypothetical protein